MRSRYFFVTLVAFLLAASVTTRSRGQGVTSPQDRVVNVVDAITLELEGTGRITLMGVVVPVVPDGQLPTNEARQAAAEFTRSQLGDGVVHVDTNVGVDRPGYTLAYVYLPDGAFLNAQLITDGYATADRSSSHEHLADFLRYEQEAREAERGLWAVEEDPEDALSDEEIKRILIQRSIASYSGSCACPYNTDRAGRRCGGRSAYSRPGGASPLCYERDVTDQMVAAYRRSHGGG